MERVMLSDELNDGVTTVSVDGAKNSVGTKAFLLGASVVGAGWLATCLFKKFRKRKAEETESEVVEKLD